MKNRVWHPRDFWRTVAYKEFRDSREWRYLLAINPSYDIRYRPAPGVKINVSGELGSGEKTPNNVGTEGLLRVSGTALVPTAAPPSPFFSTQDLFFPWDSEEQYNDRLGAYTASALLSRDRENGWSIDSRQAASDSQHG